MYFIEIIIKNTGNPKKTFRPWLVWLSGLSKCLRAKGSLVRFPGRACAWVAGQVPSRGRVRVQDTLLFEKFYGLKFLFHVSFILLKKRYLFLRVKCASREHLLFRYFFLLQFTCSIARHYFQVESVVVGQSCALPGVAPVFLGECCTLCRLCVCGRTATHFTWHLPHPSSSPRFSFQTWRVVTQPCRLPGARRPLVDCSYST